MEVIVLVIVAKNRIQCRVKDVSSGFDDSDPALARYGANDVHGG